MFVKKNLVLLVLLVIIGFPCSSAIAAEPSHGFDVQGYVELAKKSIGLALNENSPDVIMKNSQKMHEMAKEGCAEHKNASDTPKEEKKLMALVLKHADGMLALSHEELDEKWHDGGLAKANGIDIESMDHFSETMSHYDAVVLAAAVVGLVKEYQQTGNSELLEQVVDELKEAIEHMSYL